MFGLFAGCFRLAFALFVAVVGTLCALLWCHAVARKMTWFSTIEAEVIVALFIVLWVGYRVCRRALPFALVVAIAPCTGRVLALVGLLLWRVLLVGHHIILEGF